MPSAFDGYPPRERVKLKVICPYCEGKPGPLLQTPTGGKEEQPCPKCHGTGTVEREF